jgi:hypothetical protein
MNAATKNSRTFVAVIDRWDLQSRKRSAGAPLVHTVFGSIPSNRKSSVVEHSWSLE